MYRRPTPGQLSFENFYLPFGGKLSGENRWVKLSELIPWQELESKYAIANVDEFEPNSFDTILTIGNNFGLFGDAENAKLSLKKLSRITSSEAQIIAGTRNPYRTNSREHSEYHEFNRQRGRMPGQIRMRVR